MLPYWILIGTICGLTLIAGPDKESRFQNSALILLFFVLTAFVGFRDYVGPDWLAYQFRFDTIRITPIRDLLIVRDPGYSFLSFVVDELGRNIHFLNFICALICFYGLFKFAKITPYPFVTIISIFSVLVILFFMTATRQAVAVGCFLAAFANFNGKISMRWIAWLAVGAAFHASLLITMPIFFYALRNRSIISLLTMIVLVSVGFSFLVFDHVDLISDRYIYEEVDSKGVFVRFSFLITSIIITFWKKKDIIKYFPSHNDLIFGVNLYNMALIVLSFYIDSSTIADRISYYTISVFGLSVGILIFSLSRSKAIESFMKALVCVLGTAVFWVYVNFSSHWQHFEPYSFSLQTKAVR